MANGLIRLSVLSSSIFAQVADRHELPAAQARLLCVLAGGPRRMSELAAMLGVEKAALTGLADRAERRGLIARTAVPGDRRALSVALTPSGFDAARAFHRELSAELARLTDVLPAAECARFSRSLDRITADAPWPLPRLRRYPGWVAHVAGPAICVTNLTRRVRRSVVFKLLPRTPAVAPERYLPGAAARPEPSARIQLDALAEGQ